MVAATRIDQGIRVGSRTCGKDQGSLPRTAPRIPNLGQLYEQIGKCAAGRTRMPGRVSISVSTTRWGSPGTGRAWM